MERNYASAQEIIDKNGDNAILKSTMRGVPVEGKAAAE